MRCATLQPVILRAALGLGALAIGATGTARGQLILDELEATKGVGVVDRRGEALPLDAELRDANGRTVTLGDYFDGRRPVLVVPAYYDCPLLCTMVLDRVQDGLNGMAWTAGEEYRVLTFSFDHSDTTAQARAKQELTLFGYAHEVEDPDGAWSFCTADAANARAICKALGYHYRYLPETGEFSHNAAIFFVRPDGTVNGFIEGLEYPSQQLTLALSEAGDGKVGTMFDRIVFSCYRYDPRTGQYVISPMNVMRIGASGGAGVLLLIIGGAALRGAHNRRSARAASGGAGSGGVVSRGESGGEVVRV